MQTKIFYLIGGVGSSVIDVGMRPFVIYHGSGIYGLKIVAHNIPANNTTKVDQVEIIIRGREEQLLAFYNYVKSNDIRQFKKDVRPKVTELNVYKGEEPDWTYCITSTMHEQIYKGFEMLGKSTEATQSFQMTVEKNRREDRGREEKSRREDRGREEKSRREDRGREEKNRREDRGREEKNRREDREYTNKILYEIKEIKEQGERNRKEDREREERYWERTDKRFEKLLTNQTEILNILRP